ncbi:integral membrane protein [Talaromyces stipitatus ATCC 10500]|uniref:Integral membrane protein n=1 Tax=Talaromyces stipitatus (strain ATCC 10500 / CBS 375.48 / QM 6759 / NRRL 1006) TaxID=441959 RepID=B8MLG7_TALSN|nr:uncharacterized protein TSTA_049370 [Talaromyces stipitatus ATCC 10500]EED15500.1 integral membrane protein [Talaromyces stipitatus ATCC 10500]
MAVPRERAVHAHLIQPILKAYGLGYLALTTPRLLGFIPLLVSKNATYRAKLEKLHRILLGGLGLNKFSTFCAVLVGGSTWLPFLFFRYIARSSSRYSSKNVVRIVRFVSTCLSGWAAFNLLNKKSEARGLAESNAIVKHSKKERPLDVPQTQTCRPVLAGRSLDLTLFTFTRAAGVIASLAWTEWERRRKSKGKWSPVETIAPRLADAGLFAGSAAVVMWAWFYAPERLPRSYEKWIGEAAQVDGRLIEALRRARRGQFVYGKDTGQAPLLESMCEDYGWPIHWGDPAVTVPIPCEMVHMGCGPNCEWHALSRFIRSFKFAMLTNLPLQLILRVRAKQPATTLNRAVKDATRSSTFLALFISLIYYGVCLSRTRLGPKIFSSKTVTPMMWDSGLCVGAGCFMCGWSILVETAPRRQEIALFVAPRAAATILPRRYERKYLMREQIAFALSAAVLLTCAQERPDVIRGVFGRLLSSVFV